MWTRLPTHPRLPEAPCAQARPLLLGKHKLAAVFHVEVEAHEEAEVRAATEAKAYLLARCGYAPCKQAAVSPLARVMTPW